MTNFSLMVSTLKQNIARAVVGKDDVVELMLTALLCEGHVLIEDVPGVGKTTLASALARSLSCSFKRIQFTPDITCRISPASPCPAFPATCSTAPAQL
ncbi:MAG: AAA family ATPase [Christensenellales bacterium]